MLFFAEAKKRNWKIQKIDKKINHGLAKTVNANLLFDA
jgi:hypothetical protein